MKRGLKATGEYVVLQAGELVWKGVAADALVSFDVHFAHHGFLLFFLSFWTVLYPSVSFFIPGGDNCWYLILIHIDRQGPLMSVNARLTTLIVRAAHLPKYGFTQQ